MKILLTLILVNSIFICIATYAEEDNETGNPPAEKDQSDEQNVDIRLEEFVPSEEISIDKPVAFPVDI